MIKYNPNTLHDVAVSLDESVQESRSELVMPLAELEKQGKLTKVDEDAIIRLALRIVDKRRFAALIGVKPEEYTPELILSLIQEAEEKERARTRKRLR